MLTISVASGFRGSGVAGNSPPDFQSAGPAQHDEQAMLAGLIHDLRQPLSVIEMCADYLNLVLPAGESLAREQVELLQQQVDDASRILCEASRPLLSYPAVELEPAGAPAAASRPFTKAASSGVA